MSAGYEPSSTADHMVDTEHKLSGTIFKYWREGKLPHPRESANERTRF